MNKLTKSMIMGAVLCGSLGMLTTASAADPAEFFLDDVVVTAGRYEQTEFQAQADVTVINRQQIEEHHYKDLAEALKDVPGVQVQTYGASGENYTSNRLYINGSQDLVVLVDGMRANVNGSGKGLQASEYSNMDTIERIEVLKGSAGVLYGSDAVGGVINIITRKSADPSCDTTVGFTRGSYEQKTYNFLNRGYQDGYNWMVAAKKNKIGDFKDGHGNTVIHGIDVHSYSLDLGKEIGEDSNVAVHYNKYKSDYIRPESGGLSETIKPVLGSKDIEKYSIQWNQKINDNLTNTVSLFRHNNKLWDQKNVPGSHWNMDLATLGATEQITFRDDRNTLVAGFDFYQDRIDNYLSESAWGNSEWSNKRLNNRAWFIQDDFKITDKVNITPGIRYTDTSEFGDNTSKSVTVGYNNDKANVYASYKEFFVVPSQFERFGKYGGSYLKPSDGHTYEFGVNYDFGSDLFADFNVYKRQADNMIAWDSMAFKYGNIQNEKTTGFSLDLNKKFSDKFAVKAAYVYTHIPAENEFKNKNRDGYIPEGQVILGLDYNVSKLNANVTGRAVINRPGRKFQQIYKTDAAGKFITVNEPIDIPSGLKTFWICDLSLNYRADDSIKGFVRVNNVFDKFYTDQLYIADPATSNWYSQPGRNYQVGIEYTF